MRQPFEGISSETVRVLGEVINGEQPATAVLPTTLIRRNST
jgi:DNA-binding LacI/PurR family transcriptional regulator